MTPVAENGPAAATPAMRAATTVGPLMSKKAMAVFLEERLRQPHGFQGETRDDAVLWFLFKRANAVVNRWLQNSRLGVLTPLSPQKTGCILLTRERLDHVREHRDNQHVGVDAVAELMTQLFCGGGGLLLLEPELRDPRRGLRPPAYDVLGLVQVKAPRG